MPTIVYPASDGYSGSWLASGSFTTRWQSMGSGPNDLSYAYQTGSGQESGSVQLAVAQNPSGTNLTQFTMGWRGWAGATLLHFNIYLYQGSTLIAGLSGANLPATTWTNQGMGLTSAQANNITDFTNLYVLTARSGNTQTMEIRNVYLQVPDKSGSAAQSMYVFNPTNFGDPGMFGFNQPMN